MFGLPKGSPFTAKLNDAILQMRGNGVIDQIKRRWVDDLDQCAGDNSQVSKKPKNQKTGLLKASVCSSPLCSTAGVYTLVFAMLDMQSSNLGVLSWGHRLVMLLCLA